MVGVPGMPARWRGRLVERDRWQWYAASGGDPIRDLASFLLSHGLAVADLSTTPAEPVDDSTRPVGAAGPVGAALLLGAAAGPPETRAAGFAPSPCPAVPDAVAVVYESAGAREVPPARAETRTGAPGADAGTTRPGARTSPGGVPRTAPSDGGTVPACAEAGIPLAGGRVTGPWTPSWSPAEHAAAVEAVRQAIARGDLYQANLVGHRWAPYEGDPAAAGSALAALPDAPYAGGLDGAGWAVHTASPELFLQVSGGVAETRPIKGTARRAAGPAADEAARHALRSSRKDRAEHVMIVDLERNDLGRVAVTGGVRVDELYEVRPLAGLWHAESVVRARLRRGVGLADLLSATFPGGSVTGAPKLAALAEIARHEPVGRGPAMGALGWVGAGGELTLSLTIRTIAVTEGRAHLWTGGGITWGSDPWDEVAEAEAKAAPLLAALAATTGTGTYRPGIPTR